MSTIPHFALARRFLAWSLTIVFLTNLEAIAAGEEKPATMPEIVAVPLEPAWVDTLAELEGGTGGLSMDSEGNVYSSEFGNWLGNTPAGESRGGTRVFQITPDGEVSVFAQGFLGASGSAINTAGEFFQSNIGGNFISRVDSKGKVHKFCSEGIQNPVGLEVDPDGTLWVANCGSGSIQKITPEGKSTQFVTSPLLKCPNGITRGADGNLYVANFSDGNVIQITPEAKVKVLATLPGNNNGHLVYEHGSLWVVARSAHQIWRVELDGTKTLVAGTGEQGDSDGLPGEATFSLPNDLGFSPDGTILYVNEVADVESKGQKLYPTRLRTIEFE